MKLNADDQGLTFEDQGLGTLTMYMQEYGAELLDKIILHESIAEHFPGGLCAFDKNLNMTVCNSQLKELLDYPDNLFNNGLPTMEELFRFKAERGEYGPGDIETHVTSRMRLVALRQPHRYERQLPNGKIIEVQGRPLDGGGFVTIYSDVTKQRLRSHKLEALINSFPGGICVFDDTGQMILHNESVSQMIDHAPLLFQKKLPDFETYLRLNAKNGLYGDRNAFQVVADRRNALTNGQILRSDFTNSDERIVNINTMPLKNGGIVETFVDVTEVRTRSMQSEAVLQHFPGGIAAFDSNFRLTYHNEAFKVLLDYPDTLFKNGMPSAEDLFRFNAERGEYGPGDVEELVTNRLALIKEQQQLRFERVRPDGTILEIQITPIDGGGLLATYLDITKRMEREISDFHSANYSLATGLPNQRLFLDRLSIAVALAERGLKLALLRLEIIRFSHVVARAGQKTADSVLGVLGERFSNVIRDTDTFAHFNGDSFAVIQMGIEDSIGAEVLARRILRGVREPLEVDGHVFELDARIGIALAPQDGTFADDLQTKAESALHGARGLQHHNILFYRTYANEGSC